MINFKKIRKYIILLTTLISWLSSYSQDPIEIIRKVEDNMHGDASYSELTMTTERPRYTREISMKSWSLNDEYALILIMAPARDKGTAFLKRGNEIWNYVPNIDRTVKMPPSMMAQSWMGSDFSNDDLVRGSSTVNDYTHSLLGSETIDGLDCYVLELIPKPETPIVFDKVIYWVSKKHYLPVKIENYDEFDELASIMNFKDFREMGGRLIPAVIEMIPTSRSGHKTTLTTHKADYNISLDQGFFSLQNLTSIR